MGGGGGVVAGTPLAAVTLHHRDEPRQASAPGVSRAVLRHERGHSVMPSIALHNSTNSELTRLSELPPVSRHRRTSASRLKQTSTAQLLPTVSGARAPGGAARRRSPSSPSIPAPSSETHTFLQKVPLLAVPRGAGEEDVASSPPEHPSPAPRTTANAPVSAPSASPLSLKLAGHITTETRARSPSAASATRVSSVTNSRCKGRDGRITVVVRKRPLGPGEPGVDCVQVDRAHVRIAVTKQRVDLTSYEESSDYVFDSAFGAEATNEEVYAHSVKDLLTVSLSGGSASCFAYGQTGSGKTYTMMGTDTEKGLYLHAAWDLFERLRPGQQLCVSFFEIYCNSLYDLLNHRHPIVLREDANRRVNICGVTWRTVATVEELWQLVRSGMEQRRTGTTTANEHSSRSHAVLSLRITDSENPDFTGSVNFVDLAGSERAADTAAHDRLTRLEGAEINKSLLALKECIRALDEKKKHVPFRGSRLTEVLRASFTGNSKTVMIAAVSPSSVNHEHTSNTLRYAFRVKGLSVPSVWPSTARNAPRLCLPVARSRSRAAAAVAAANEPTSAPAATECSFNSKHTDDAGSPRRPRHARRRRHAYKTAHEPQDEIGISDTNESCTSDTATESPRPRMQITQKACRHQVGRNSTGSSTSAKRHKTCCLVPYMVESLSQRRTRHRTRKERLPLPRAACSIGESSDLLLANASGTDSKSRALAEVILPHVKGATRHPSSLIAVDVAALEQRLTLQIIAQLRLDLGQQLEEVLMEKDTIISALRSENEKLRQALDKTGNVEQFYGGSPCDGEVQKRPAVLPALLYPSSPSILQEQLSSGVSTASVGDEPPLRVLSE
ncbi:putative mitotic centromere-associated kinesin (MCAK) [Leishmania major strain Friedlin]|uniref:Kinesin-like protein n=1 Tax=Leishmania major TaxID=5664 RepID=Q4Q6N4_LEIMA|nr:putative mitotic centromere-associated kinesin (MCAK) [Leishmania major strain Friedlin]CAG9579180.1 Kinesin-13_4_-_putative [Leishmania major strain Friedlin]CAJ08216.1 putative mitotic centromere-associated kinesin (MCAK) [Leishmania major strain Friedlin]|eukprot:XP_001685014.1 putative mitotic centromere-associated kinesin (MCAK) [Leishmania major strain Friedlin]